MTFILFLNMYLFIWLHQVLVATCKISFPNQGLNLVSLHRTQEFQPLDHQESSKMTFKYIVLYYNIVVVNINQVFSVCLTLV